MDQSLLTPGLIDLQVNGYGGYDVNAEDVTADTVVALTHALWAEGITSYLPTVITASEERIKHSLSQIAAARRTDPLIAHSIVGVHVEGPYLASDDGPRGAHAAAHLRNPDLAELERWQQASDNLVRIVTLAPERLGSTAYIAGAVARGVRISIGHTGATAELVAGAVTAGATLSTHLGNGTYPVLPRHPNHIWAQLARDQLTAMLIADGHHLPADTLTAMIRAKGVTRSILTSDSVALGGVAPGQYHAPVGGNVTVHEDGHLTLSGSHLLAGSGHSLRHGLAWAKQNLPYDTSALLTMTTTNPAALLGISERVGTVVKPKGDTVHWHGGEVATVRVANVEVYRT